MDMPLISVIVPVYKAEPYLTRCVDSIRNQTYTNLEIILVDDGSPDRCGELCDTFAEEDARIRVFHKENGGQSSARNMGLDHMRGEYVAFVDSDDWIEPDTYQHLYALITQYGGQIACCGIQNNYSDGTVTYYNGEYPQNKEVRVYSTIAALGESLRNEKITYSPCDKLYHKEIFASLRMRVGTIYEDMEIIPKCIERAATIVYDPIPLYHYFMTAESTIRGKFHLNRFAEADVAWEKLEDYQIRYPELYDKAYGSYISVCLNIIYKSWGEPSCDQRRDLLIQQLRAKLPKTAIAALRKKDKLKLKLLRIHPSLFVLAMGFYEKMK